MANYCFNIVAFRGSKESILSLFNLAFKNCHLKIQSDVDEAFRKLGETFTVNGSTCNSDGTLKIEQIAGLHLGTFFPMPKTFLKWDTTNYGSTLKNVAKYQKSKYGVSGWYDYNVLVRFGTKWDTSLSDLNLYVNNDDTVTFTARCETPWTPPQLWLDNLSKIFPDLKVYLCTNEESGEIIEYYEVNSDDNLVHDFKPLLPDYPEDDDDYGQYLEDVSDTISQMECEFLDYVTCDV